MTLHPPGGGRRGGADRGAPPAPGSRSESTGDFPDSPRPVLERAGPARLPTPFATFTITVFREAATGLEHAAIVLGEVSGPLASAPLARLHSECLTGDALFSLRCDCGFQLRAALERIAGEGRGVLLYLRQEGRGIGLANKIRAYELQDQGADTVEANERLGLPADARRFDVAVAMLDALGVRGVRLMTNNPRKVTALEAAGIRAERVPLAVGANPHNQAYLSTKAERLGHLLSGADDGADGQVAPTPGDDAETPA